jgi:hypothetical protein
MYMMERLQTMWVRPQETLHRDPVWPSGCSPNAMSPHTPTTPLLSPSDIRHQQQHHQALPPQPAFTFQQLQHHGPRAPPPLQSPRLVTTPDAPSVQTPRACNVSPATFSGRLHVWFFDFQCSAKPAISIGDYAAKLVRECDVAPASLVRAMFLLATFRRIHPDIPFTPFTMHRLILVAVLVSSKFDDDKSYGNKQFARVGSVTSKELNLLEQKFVSLIEWEIAIPAHKLEAFYRAVVAAKPFE